MAKGSVQLLGRTRTLRDWETSLLPVQLIFVMCVCVWQGTAPYKKSQSCLFFGMLGALMVS